MKPTITHNPFQPPSDTSQFAASPTKELSGFDRFMKMLGWIVMGGMLGVQAGPIISYVVGGTLFFEAAGCGLFLGALGYLKLGRAHPK